MFAGGRRQIFLVLIPAEIRLGIFWLHTFHNPQLHFAVYESVVTGGRQILKPKFLVSLSFGMTSPNNAAPTVYNLNSEPAVPIGYIATWTEGHALMSLHEMYHP